MDELFITNGWTALWDGIRLANDVLEFASVVPTPRGNRPRVCVDRARRSIVAYTDGYEKNSADEHDTSYEGDGVDTTLEQLMGLQVHGTPTPLHLVGIGDELDESTLEALADANGGQYVHVDHIGQLHGALMKAAARLTTQVPICFEPPDCGHTEARITLTVEHEGETIRLVLPLDLPPDVCADSSAEKAQGVRDRSPSPRGAGVVGADCRN